MPARSQVPLPAGEWWRGRVGTLQPATCSPSCRHSLDIQRQCPCLLGIVPRLTMATSTRLQQEHRVLHWRMAYSSLSCVTRLPACGTRRAVLPQSLAAQSQCWPFLRLAVTHLRQGRDFGRGWVEGVFDQISILRRELACLVPRSILLYFALPCAQQDGAHGLRLAPVSHFGTQPHLHCMSPRGPDQLGGSTSRP